MPCSNCHCMTGFAVVVSNHTEATVPEKGHLCMIRCNNGEDECTVTAALSNVRFPQFLSLSLFTYYSESFVYCRNIERLQLACKMSFLFCSYFFVPINVTPRYTIIRYHKFYQKFSIAGFLYRK